MAHVGVFLIAGVLIGGFVAWHLKLAHRGWEDWRQAVARVDGTRKLFFHHAGRGVLVTAVAAIVLFAVIR